MSAISRRKLLAGVGVTAAGVAVAQGIRSGDAFLAAGDESGGLTPPGPVTIGPSDPRYQDLLLRGYNKRFVARPEGVRIVWTTGHVVRAVNDAVRAGKRIAVRAGGHNLDGLVDDPAVQIIVDFTEMRFVGFDVLRNAFVIEPGATLGQIYRNLDYSWGVTIPGGICPAVGAGGHIIGGGVGVLSRQYGLVADLLHAVEVVVVDARGVARPVVATNNPNDPNYDLWWAHSGGGGGNFGVVTRFWLRLPRGTSESVPGALLPRVPGGFQVGRAIWNWSDMTASAFNQLARNFSAWHEQNSAPGAAGNALYASLIAPRKESGKIIVSGQIDPTMPGATQLLTDFLTAVRQNVTPTPLIVTTPVQPWLSSTINIPDTAVSVGVLGPPRSKTKGAYLKQRYSDTQIDRVYRHLTRADYSHPSSVFTLAGYGGKINALSTTDTATAHRDSVMLASVFSAWDVPTDDARHLAWNREFYRDLHAGTGGVPVPNGQTDGCYINWPDVDLADPVLNPSSTSWFTLYYKNNYSRLQRIKAKYDPRNVFQHTLSIRP